MAQRGDRNLNFPEQRRQPGASAPGGREGETGDVVGAVTEKAQEWASTARSTAEQAWETTRQSAEQLSSAFTGSAGDAWDSAVGFVRRYPLPSLLFAFGVGFLVAGGMQCMAEMNRSSYSDRY